MLAFIFSFSEICLASTDLNLLSSQLIAHGNPPYIHRVSVVFFAVLHDHPLSDTWQGREGRKQQNLDKIQSQNIFLLELSETVCVVYTHLVLTIPFSVCWQIVPLLLLYC